MNELPEFFSEIHIVKKIVESGNDINKTFGNNKKTLLHYAVERENIDTVKYLLAMGADVNMPDKYMGTPLHTAVFDGNYAIVECLVESGANVNVLDSVNRLPLDIAIYKMGVGDNRYTQIAKYLIKSGSDVNNVHLGQTPLCVAAANGNLDMVKYLLVNGADKEYRGCSVSSTHPSTASEIAIGKCYFEIARYIDSFEYMPMKGVYE